ncbi:uncharacterized protein M421DRAFT_6757 [Didymella exigua CBS 183.55]|uniref:Uncharacterized protein n=1 Tax=Didymella exigua CBS 183.55 TaxID=1150837 RepID=A0A6A5RID7_9PLEO|nr:uncharacterized protein M421DRAFT_6757 [Didymella exigua CBS 183.55]KAF1926854.1 hypothetical protein M421DRAFT_6757 [Didymella exigua CBS 183.55]
MSDETPAERVSRFHEHTNTNSSIRAPPDELWKDVGIERLLDKFSDENDSTPAVRRPYHPRKMMAPTGHRKSPSTPAARKQSDAAATVATAEGTFGRFGRVFANVFGGVLGKRKAGLDDAAPEPRPDAAQAALDERKRAAEEAYHVAKAQGLLPAPKVFVRPGTAPRAWSADGPASGPRRRAPPTPRTPGSVARSPSKKDLGRQEKLSRRVSSLELKLASAKKELQSVLANECIPAVPPLPAHVSTDDAAPLSPSFADDGRVSPVPSRQPSLKRARRDASTRLKRTSSRLSRKVSRNSMREDREEERVVVIKPGGAVPPVPAIPQDATGRPAIPQDATGRPARVCGGGGGGGDDDDDGYGGLGHEMF